MVMFTNDTEVVAYDLKGHKVKIPSHCYVYIMTANNTEYRVKNLCFGKDMVEVPRRSFEKHFHRC
jgi:hypothetical protein